MRVFLLSMATALILTGSALASEKSCDDVQDDEEVCQIIGTGTSIGIWRAKDLMFILDLKIEESDGWFFKSFKISGKYKNIKTLIESIDADIESIDADRKKKGDF